MKSFQKVSIFVAFDQLFVCHFMLDYITTLWFCNEIELSYLQMLLDVYKLNQKTINTIPVQKCCLKLNSIIIRYITPGPYHVILVYPSLLHPAASLIPPVLSTSNTLFPTPCRHLSQTTRHTFCFYQLYNVLTFFVSNYGTLYIINKL